MYKIIRKGGMYMRKLWKKLYVELRVQLRILRLYFVRVPEPEDAKSPEQMLKEIKEASKLT